MSADNVTKFLEKVSSDAAFRSQLEQAAAKNQENAQAEVQKIVADAGFSFTAKEYRDATAALRESNLSDKDLGSVVGGLISSTSLLSRGSVLDRMFATSSKMFKTTTLA